jgi:hypothetical protein
MFYIVQKQSNCLFIFIYVLFNRIYSLCRWDSLWKFQIGLYCTFFRSPPLCLPLTHSPAIYLWKRFLCSISFRSMKSSNLYTQLYPPYSLFAVTLSPYTATTLKSCSQWQLCFQLLHQVKIYMNCFLPNCIFLKSLHSTFYSWVSQIWLIWEGSTQLATKMLFSWNTSSTW